VALGALVMVTNGATYAPTTGDHSLVLGLRRRNCTCKRQIVLNLHCSNISLCQIQPIGQEQNLELGNLSVVEALLSSVLVTDDLENVLERNDIGTLDDSTGQSCAETLTNTRSVGGTLSTSEGDDRLSILAGVDGDDLLEVADEILVEILLELIEVPLGVDDERGTRLDTLEYVDALYESLLGEDYDVRSIVLINVDGLDGVRADLCISTNGYVDTVRQVYVVLPRLYILALLLSSFGKYYGNVTGVLVLINAAGPSGDLNQSGLLKYFPHYTLPSLFQHFHRALWYKPTPEPPPKTLTTDNYIH